MGGRHAVVAAVSPHERRRMTKLEDALHEFIAIDLAARGSLDNMTMLMDNDGRIYKRYQALKIYVMSLLGGS